MKKFMKLILCSTMVISPMATFVFTNQFKAAETMAGIITFNDIQDDHWAVKAINHAVETGIVDGFPDGSFQPDNSVTRAQFVKMAATALKLPAAPGGTGSWYKPFVDAAITKGILRETDFPSDGFNEPISRMEMSKIALRAVDASFQDPKAISNDQSIMYSAVKLGLIQGLSYGELAPDKTTTRAQSVTIIERILTTNAGGKLEVDNTALNNAELALKKTNIFTVMPEFFGGKQYEDGKWDPNNLTMETPDGLYKGAIDQIIAIDLEDLNDPNLYLLGDINKLHWFDLMSYETSRYIKDGYLSSYVLYFKGHVDYNKDTKIYSDQFNYPSYGLSGFNGEIYDKETGKLTRSAFLFKDKVGDMPAYIIPKKGATTVGSIGITISAPARPPHPNYYKFVLRAMVP